MRAPDRPSTLVEKWTRLAAVVREHVARPGIYQLRVAHDATCPALATRRLADCTCEPEFLPPERLA